MSTSRIIALVIISITLSILASQLFFKPQVQIAATIQEDVAMPAAKKNQQATKADVKLKQTSDDSPTITNVESDNSPNLYFELNDETAINTLFVNEAGAIERKALVDVLTRGMNDFIEQVSNLPANSEFAIERQNKLNQQLLQLNNMALYEQNIGCAGRICALSITTNELTEANKKLIQNFDSNLSFVNTSENATGELEFKAIYIYTEDPSQLVMTQH
ncbi:hypothetical protein [Shewanella sp. MBTL60-007]|uniref:hypothetical protein n=1 Tax=Shewanella sp. MBTL60-007 TaxID=2815911 RepID=UPI001BC25C3E|nr:hypothetical protein [Shewanella sp. MBTL60-007]GIU20409.1 hypothetical protein TUM3792_19570 [Shewanella sp. MBTL60-007]